MRSINTLLKKISGIFRPDSPQIIVSLTSYPARINNLQPMLNSLFAQTRQPDKIILWLADTEFAGKEADLPQYLIDLQQQGKIFIEWCKDLKPHKKYFYALQKYRNDIVITVDDDLLFAPDMVECLLDSYAEFPHAVSAMRSHIMRLEDGKFAKYNRFDGEQNKLIRIPSMRLLATNGAGSLFPPNLLKFKYFDEKLITELCLNTDDLWLKIIEVLSGVPVVQARAHSKLIYVENSQDCALWHLNTRADGNDISLGKITEWADRRFGKGFLPSKIFFGPHYGGSRFNAIFKKFSGRNTIIYFAPHQDDELLTFGVDITSAIAHKKDVHVVLCTNGAKSCVRQILNNKKTCPWHSGKHIYDLSESEFTAARDAEFTQSCAALGIKPENIHILPHRATDGNLQTEFAEAVIIGCLSQFGGKSTVCTIYHGNGLTQHRDHKALGFAVENLFKAGAIQKLRFFCEPYCLKDSTADFMCKKATPNDIRRIKYALNAYSLWKPQQQRYAVGYHSVPKELDDFRHKKRAYYFKMQR